MFVIEGFVIESFDCMYTTLNNITLLISGIWFSLLILIKIKKFLNHNIVGERNKIIYPFKTFIENYMFNGLGWSNIDMNSL